MSSRDQIIKQPIHELDVHELTENYAKQNCTNLRTIVHPSSDTFLNGIAFADDEEEEELDYIQRYVSFQRDFIEMFLPYKNHKYQCFYFQMY